MKLARAGNSKFESCNRYGKRAIFLESRQRRRVLWTASKMCGRRRRWRRMMKTIQIGEQAFKRGGESKSHISSSTAFPSNGALLLKSLSRRFKRRPNHVVCQLPGLFIQTSRALLRPQRCPWISGNPSKVNSTLRNLSSRRRQRRREILPIKTEYRTSRWRVENKEQKRTLPRSAKILQWNFTVAFLYATAAYHPFLFPIRRERLW